MITRRKFLKHSSVTGLGVASGLATSFASFNAFAADTSGYKALVCVFLAGGMDGHDMLIPWDNASYNDYEVIREGLLSRLDNSSEGFAPRRRNNLLRLNGTYGGRRYAFPEEMRPLQELFNQGDAAVVGNVGPLIEPVTREMILNGSANSPPRIGSHNDSQSIWMASQPEGASSGWGGRFGDIMQAANANMNGSFTSVSAAGRAIFLTGETVQAFQVSGAGGLAVTHLNSNALLGSSVFSMNYESILRDVGRTNQTSSFFAQDMSDIMSNAIDNNTLLAGSLAGPGNPTTSFPTTGLGGQLEIVARMISRREALGAAGRQVFFVQAGGYDTHSDQTGILPGLQQDLANSMRAFHDAMTEIGTANNVTSFTASDFGRTLSRSGSGTDHGWGNHHIVMGGAVNGGQILGEVPPPEFGHDYDMGRGRLIPQIAVDQYAGSLGGWFGLSDSELLDVLPGLANFNTGALNDLFV